MAEGTKSLSIVELGVIEDRLLKYREAAETGLSGLMTTISTLDTDLDSIATTYTEAATLMSTGWKDDDGKKEMGVVSLMAEATKRLQTNAVGNSLSKCVEKMQEVYDIIKETYDEYQKIKEKYDDMTNTYNTEAKNYDPRKKDKWNSEKQEFEWDDHEQALIDEWNAKAEVFNKEIDKFLL